MIRNWIVITGQLIDSTEGGGFEFHGPFTEEEAQAVVKTLSSTCPACHFPIHDDKVQAVELLGVYHRTILKSGLFPLEDYKSDEL